MVECSDKVLYLGTLSVSLMSVVNGLFAGWTSPVLPRLTAPDSPIPLSETEAEWVVSSLSLGLLLSPLPTGLLAGRLGPRTALLCSALPALISWLLTLLAQSSVELIAARVLAGVTTGAVLTATPMYVGEIARDANRGALGTAIHVATTVGTLFAYSVGPYISYAAFTLACAAFPLLFLVTFFWMPESPYFLLIKGRPRQAAASLTRLRGGAAPELVQHELDAIQRSLDEKTASTGSLADLIRTRGNRKALLIMIVLSSTLIFSGHSFIMAFSGFIFRLTDSSIDANVSSIMLAVVQVVFSVVPSFLIERAGRRPLLLVSAVGVAVSMLVEGLFFFLKMSEGLDMGPVDWLPLVSLVLFLVFYSVGLGSLALAMMGEMFHHSVKRYAVAVVGMLGAILYVAVTQLYMVIARKFGLYVVFWVSAICCIAAAAFIAVFVPETKGKSLDEIAHLLNGGPSDVQQVVLPPSTGKPSVA